MSSTRATGAAKLAGFVAYLVGLPTVILWLSGDWRWIEGWIFGAWFATLARRSYWQTNYQDYSRKVRFRLVPHVWS